MQPPTFDFDINAPRTRFTDDQLIAALQEFGRLSNGASLRTEDFQAWPARPCYCGTIAKRFGGWNEALRRAGFKASLSGLRRNDELMMLLESAWRTLKRPPGRQSLLQLAGVDAHAFRTRWGSLRRACRLLALHRKGKLSRKKLIQPSHAAATRARLRSSTRFTIMERDGHKCILCGKGPPDGVKLEVDHIRPVSKGGTNTPENLRTLCGPCNRGKGSRVPTRPKPPRIPRRHAKARRAPTEQS